VERDAYELQNLALNFTLLGLFVDVRM
jgi:hypothetical protein